MNGAERSWSGWASAARHGATSSHAPVATSLLLGLLAALQVLVQQVPGYLGPGAPVPPPKIFLVLIALATTLPLGLLWAQPRTAAMIIAIADLLSLGVVHAPTVAGAVALVVVVYRLGYLRAQTLAATIAVAFVALALVQRSGIELILLSAAVPLAVWAGSAQRVRADSAARNAQQEFLAGSLMEHTARAERARISRELHDVVAHHISMIAVQAETARLTTQGMPPAGAQRLLAIGDTARSALTEMRRLLGVLRDDAEPQLTRRRPQPGLSQLNELLDDVRDASGCATRLIVSGWLTPLDPGVEVAAYRIVQEALTNARRHAPGAAVDVELHYAEDSLHMRVRDNGPGPAQTDTAGNGLLGMRERAAAVGGTLTTGPSVGGGFLVEAVLPAKAEEGAA
jgi:signal transduction histidine kinase